MCTDRSFFRNTWTIIFSKQDETVVHCTQSKSDFSVRNGEINDCTKHINSQAHKKFAEKPDAKMKQHKLYFQPPPTSEKEQQLQRQNKALAVFFFYTTIVVVHNNLSLSSADELRKAIKYAFPDYEIAQEYMCKQVLNCLGIVLYMIISSLKIHYISFCFLFIDHCCT